MMIVDFTPQLLDYDGIFSGKIQPQLVSIHLLEQAGGTCACYERGEQLGRIVLRADA